MDVYRLDYNHTPPDGVQLDRDFHNIEYGYYLTDRIYFNRYWHLTGGLRYGEFTAEQKQNDVYSKQTDENALTFNGGLAFTPYDWLTPYCLRPLLSAVQKSQTVHP